MTTPAQRCPTCGGLLAADKHSLLPPDERLTPWMIHDLPRIAWIVEYRAAELTDEERQIVHDATTRMLHALEPTPSDSSPPPVRAGVVGRLDLNLGPHPYQAHSRDAFMLEVRDTASSSVRWQ